MRLGVSHQTPEQIAGEHLAYLKQMGVESIEVRIPAAECSRATVAEVKRRVEDAGLLLHEIMMADRYNCTDIATGSPQRDGEVARFCQFLEDLGAVGIGTTTYAWHTGGGGYQTGTTMTRGCQTRLFDAKEADKLPNIYDREYGDDEMWDNYEAFITKVLPVAVGARVRLQLHPNDPPYTHGGVARIFRSTAAYRRAMEIAGHSPYSGILFCVGCWAEMFGPGGEGEDIVAAIREFGSRGQICQVHFRNIDAHLPTFHETFPDDGHLDMPAIIGALTDVGFDGMVVPDHVPVAVGSEATPQAGEAFIFGYIRGLIQSARQHAGQESEL
jgi:mannonate dehydratase